MLQAAHIVLLVFLYNHTVIAFERFYGVRTDEYPKSSCQTIANIESAGRCLGTCGILMDMIVMVSHDEFENTCMCCNNITGSDIIGSNWKTYVPPSCANGYASYDLSDSRVCLKYFPVAVTYQSARVFCQAEGGDLIKIDSQEKFNIFKDHHVPIANNTMIQVWIQSEKVGGQWQFHDGSPMPEFCPIDMTNLTTEVHLRARGSISFTCWDCPGNKMYHYSCEYHRLLAFNN